MIQKQEKETEKWFNVKCTDWQSLFEPFNILDTKEGQSLCKKYFIKAEEK